MPEQENVQTATLEAKATLRYARISSRKVKIVADLIRGKKVDEALAIIKFTPKASSEILEKLHCSLHLLHLTITNPILTYSR